jgi:hypothetical protein
VRFPPLPGVMCPQPSAQTLLTNFFNTTAAQAGLIPHGLMAALSSTVRLLAGVSPWRSVVAVTSLRCVLRQVSADKNYAFVDFASPDVGACVAYHAFVVVTGIPCPGLQYATACLGLDGVVFMGVSLKIKRPSNYKPGTLLVCVNIWLVWCFPLPPTSPLRRLGLNSFRLAASLDARCVCREFPDREQPGGL